MKKFLTVILFGLLANSPLMAEENGNQRNVQLEDLQSLINNSPFQSLEFKQRIARAGQGGLRQFAFNGYVRLSGDWVVALRDNESQETSWVKVGDEFRSHTVSSFNRRNERVTLTRDGHEITLNLDTGR